MRNGKVMRRVGTLGVAAASLVTSLIIVAGESNAAVVKPHTSYPTYNAALVASRQREIWPYVDGSRFTVTNVSDTQQPMYRPLYWFGLGASTTYQPALSLANTPVFSNGGKTVTIKLKGWNFYNEVTNKTEQIQAKNVEFWLNLAKADPTGYGGYTPGYGIPDQIASTKIVNTQEIQINLKSAANPNWFLYNALATVTPLPSEWDTTSLTDPTHHMVGCENLAFTAVTAGSGPCDAVYQTFSDDTDNYAADNVLDVFKVYSGPYMLSTYHYAADSTYNVTLVPNPNYSGPVKAHVQVRFNYFGTTQAEVTALEAGNVLSAGGALPSLVSAAPTPGQAGTNLDGAIAAHYNARSAGFWGFDYAYINFSGHAVHNALLKQQYIRAAMQQSVDQASIIKKTYNNYAVPSCSPLPYLNDSFAKGVTCPYPYSVSKAKALLTSHGWSIPSGGGAATCTNAAKCGAGIAKGSKLNLTFEYVTSGTSPFDTTVATEQSDWNAVGIGVTLDPTSDSTVSTDCLGGTTPPTFDICEYGGWVYSPGAYPSGEQLFLNGAASNVGFVNDKTMNADIVKSISSNTTLAAYDKYAASYLPVFYQISSLSVGELAKTVVGAQPINPISDFNPEYITAV